MERLMLWRAGNKIAATTAADDDLTSWEMINPSDDDDVRSLSFSDNDSSPDDERPEFDDGVPEEDDQECDERSEFDESDVDLGENQVLELVGVRSDDQRLGFDQNGHEQERDERPGFDAVVPEKDDDQTGFDEHIARLWEYSVRLIGLDQFDDHAPGDQSSFSQCSGLVGDRSDELAENSSPRLESGYDDKLCGLDEYKACDEQDNDYDDEYDFDDNLVPFSVSNRFGKQRMGKVGKKANTGKMRKPKRMPGYYYNKVT